jgi:hypothetical protein
MTKSLRRWFAKPTPGMATPQRSWLPSPQVWRGTRNATRQMDSHHEHLVARAIYSKLECDVFSTGLNARGANQVLLLYSVQEISFPKGWD